MLRLAVDLAERPALDTSLVEGSSKYLRIPFETERNRASLRIVFEHHLLHQLTLGGLLAGTRLPIEVPLLGIRNAAGLHGLGCGCPVVKRIAAFTFPAGDSKAAPVDPFGPSTDELAVSFTDTLITRSADSAVEHL